MSTSGSINAAMKMSASALARMRDRERMVLRYYDDMGRGRGNCTWGAGILAHRGPCTKAELATPVSESMAVAEFARRVTEAESGVRRHVRTTPLNQAQFDALVSLTFNAGVGGAKVVLRHVERGELRKAASRITAMVTTKVHGKKKIARGLIARRKEESAPFNVSEGLAKN